MILEFKIWPLLLILVKSSVKNISKSAPEIVKSFKMKNLQVSAGSQCSES
jgi:hypothetical protein